MNKDFSVLVVDDNPIQVKTLVDIFTLKKIHAQGALSGQEALMLLKDRQFNAMLTDIKMPSMNGLDLFREAKKINPMMPTILMTAYATDDLVKEGMQEGALVVLKKPLDINNLLAHLSSFSPD